MPSRLTLTEQVTPVRCLEPATDAAGRTGDWIDLKGATRAHVLFFVTQANAATILVTVLQAQAVAGTGSKVLTNNVPIWLVDDAATTDAWVSQTAAKNLTTSAGLTHKLICFQVDPELCMDLANGFTCITISTGASNAANLTSAVILVEQRYSQPLVPSLIV